MPLPPRKHTRIVVQRHYVASVNVFVLGMPRINRTDYRPAWHGAYDFNSESCFLASAASLELGLSFSACCNCWRASEACPLFA